MRSGLEDGLPYSFSRWTDVPAAKWSWFVDAMRQGAMLGFDPRTAVPGVWSLKPEDTLGMVFWTKDPTNLIEHQTLLAGHRLKIHVTVTGWHEVERGAPDLHEGARLLALAADTFGAENVTWRFSPIPQVSDVQERFEAILSVAAEHGIKSVFLSFLQENDLIPETRSVEERLQLLNGLAEAAHHLGVRVYLCNEDRLLAGQAELHPNLASGICAPPEDFALPNRGQSPSEGCGCVLMVDPFTSNESCTFGCRYCYAADKTLSDKKRNTTRLKVLR